ncbi:hypothetical protein BCR44DRAFT_43100 [Catenaria anguillulae PL171]|uniref:Uncharacterized protein n=1 Tax=Catenaria anguillulae PL171 TaxID=765915 RepID=A0A1Y2HYV0_9FUNG|nr:hypothetical protein BCR44DRAFT_43100 [Catenaria anguillulae PL171]
MTTSTATHSAGPTNHDRSLGASTLDARSGQASNPASASDSVVLAAKIVAVESATSLSHSLAPRQAHVTPLTLFSDHALLGPLGASLLPRSPPPPLTPHYVSDAFSGHHPTGNHVGPAGLPLVSLSTPTWAHVSSPTTQQQHGHSIHAPAAHPTRARRDSVSSRSSPSSSSTSSASPGHHAHAPAVKRTRKTSLPADHHHHPYRRRTSSSSSSSSAPISHPTTIASATTTQAQSHLQIPIHQLAAAPARNRHPKHLTLPTSGPHATLPTTTLLYSSATTFTACATAIVGTGARKRPRAISTPATFAELRGSGPEAVAVGPIEAWRGVASARAFLTTGDDNGDLHAHAEGEAAVKMEVPYSV